MEEAWFAFKAYNSQTAYGWGTQEDADEYADHLNKGKEINLYAPHQISDEEADEMELNEMGSGGFNLADALAELDDDN